MTIPVTIWRPLPGVEAARVENDPRLWAGHSTQYGVTLVRAGAFDFWYRGRVWTQAPSRLKLKEPGEVHRDLRVHAPVTAQTVAIAPSLVAEAVRALELPAAHFTTALTRGSGRAERAARRLHALLGGPAARLAVETALAEALQALLDEYAERPPGRPPARARAAERAREYLHAHLSDEVSLDGLAAATGENKFTLLRSFRRELGLTPYAFLTHLRVSRGRARSSGPACPRPR